MRFVSYAQNYEDVLLWRALQDVENGFYVDVGAGDPVTDSVTKAFYDRGWSGINVEPTDPYFDRLVESRPRDTNLKVVLGATAGAVCFHIVEGTGLSTIQPEVAAVHLAAGFRIREVTFPMLKLDDILSGREDRTIHFLKIDVEGAEADVLSGIDLRTTRPWVIVVEATEPNSAVSTRHKFEDQLTERGYNAIWFDGLNVFYVASEQERLGERIAKPVNVFDNFVGLAEWTACQQLDLQCVQASARDQRIQHLEHEAAALRETCGAFELQVAGAQEAASLARQAESVALQAAQGAQAARDEAVRDLLATQTELASTNLILESGLVARQRLADEILRVRAEQVATVQELSYAEDTLRAVTAAHEDASASLVTLTVERFRLLDTLRSLHTRVSALEASTSWRVTAPFRAVRDLLRPLPPPREEPASAFSVASISPAAPPVGTPRPSQATLPIAAGLMTQVAKARGTAGVLD